jgi:hypothetical protein
MIDYDCSLEQSIPSNAFHQTADLPTHPFFNTSGFYHFMRYSQVTLSNDPNDFIIVYGVNHVATGKATYSNIGVFGADIYYGIGAISKVGFQRNC